MKQCALHAVAASLVRESGALHGARANAGFDVPLEDSVCLDGVSGILQVLESLAAPSIAAETAQLHAESVSIGAGVSGGHSAWRSRVGGLRLRRQAYSRLGNFVVGSWSSSHHVDHVHARSVGCAHGEHDLHDARTNSCWDTHNARLNSLGCTVHEGIQEDMLIRTGVRIVHAVEFGEEQSQ